MNLDQFRQLKAEMEKGTPETKQEQPSEQVETTEEKPEDTNTETKVETTEPPKVEETNKEGEVSIDGNTYRLDEIKEWQKGYLRQTDYTKKTQELAREREQTQSALQFLQQVQQNPEIAQQLSQQFNIPTLDPSQSRIQQLENQLMDMQLQNEISTLSSKYDDFDAREVLTLAKEKKLNSLEDAYLLSKSSKPTASTQQSIDVEALTAQITEQLRKEFESSQNTSSIIGSGGGTRQVEDKTPQLSASELKVAQNLGMSPKEYATWRGK